MKTLSRDTHPKAEEVLIGLIRKASVAKRISRMHSLTRTILRLSKRAIAKANPGLSEQELNILFVKIHYGEDLANRLQKYLEQKKTHGNR
jgi:VIT1/CCC1 family predicted Fe2+/Mn2+ transporter